MTKISNGGLAIPNVVIGTGTEDRSPPDRLDSRRSGAEEFIRHRVASQTWSQKEKWLALLSGWRRAPICEVTAHHDVVQRIPQKLAKQFDIGMHPLSENLGFLEGGRVDFATPRSTIIEQVVLYILENVYI